MLLNLEKWLYPNLLFSWLKDVEVFNLVLWYKTVLFKANSSHLLVSLVRGNHSKDLILLFKGNEIPRVLEFYEWYFLEYNRPLALPLH